MSEAAEVTRKGCCCPSICFIITSSYLLILHMEQRLITHSRTKLHTCFCWLWSLSPVSVQPALEGVEVRCVLVLRPLLVKPKLMSCWWIEPMLWKWCWWSCPVLLCLCVCGYLTPAIIPHFLFLKPSYSSHFWRNSLFVTCSNIFCVFVRRLWRLSHVLLLINLYSRERSSWWMFNTVVWPRRSAAVPSRLSVTVRVHCCDVRISSTRLCCLSFFCRRWRSALPS